MYTIVEAEPEHIDFLIEADLLAGMEDEPEDTLFPEHLTPRERAAHREKIARFVEGADKGAWISIEAETGHNAGMILCRFHNLWQDDFSGPSHLVFHLLDKSLFPADGAFCEVFQLWVHPAHRKQGLATTLKKHLETVTRERGITMIYTHTLIRNQHVIRLNLKLGYQEVRRGPIWDDRERVSLVKYLD